MELPDLPNDVIILLDLNKGPRSIQLPKRMSKDPNCGYQSDLKHNIVKETSQQPYKKSKGHKRLRVGDIEEVDYADLHVTGKGIVPPPLLPKVNSIPLT